MRSGLPCVRSGLFILDAFPLSLRLLGLVFVLVCLARRFQLWFAFV